MPTLFHRLLPVVIAAFFSSQSSAHHGFGGEYDGSSPLWIEGVVNEMKVSHPHPELRITVSSATRPTSLSNLETLGGESILPILKSIQARAGTTITVEFPPVANFFQINERVKVGERVSIIAYRNCLAPHQIRGQWARNEHGEVVTRPRGNMQRTVRGCTNAKPK
jgi:hypothetical protein